MANVLPIRKRCYKEDEFSSSSSSVSSKVALNSADDEVVIPLDLSVKKKKIELQPDVEAVDLSKPAHFDCGSPLDLRVTPPSTLSSSDASSTNKVTESNSIVKHESDDDEDDDFVMPYAQVVSFTPMAPTFFRCSECSISSEHWHCKLCGVSASAFSRKEDLDRHHRWHLRHQLWLSRGFLRCTPFDRNTCLQSYPKCPHAGYQTHYHCLQPGCNRCYINTYEVQLHAATHRKDTAIAMDGFQRFRATDLCNDLKCPYRTAHTTHFHCQRPNCGYAFKVKADMEKHKIYHQRDDDYLKDGFRKFMKYQICPFAQKGCNLSKATNHIHCLRCGYVLHSSGQLTSHRRKHEREDREKSLPGRPSLTAVSPAGSPPRLPLPPLPEWLPSSPSLTNSGRSAFQPVANNQKKQREAKSPPSFQNTSSDVDVMQTSTSDNESASDASSLFSVPAKKQSLSQVIEVQSTTSGPDEPCPRGGASCIYSGRSIEHFHCPLVSTENSATTCSCAFTRLATLKLHLKAVHNHNLEI